MKAVNQIKLPSMEVASVLQVYMANCRLTPCAVCACSTTAPLLTALHLEFTGIYIQSSDLECTGIC